MIWTLKKADTETSNRVRKRDGVCMYPGCTKTTELQCSHFHKRSHSATRFYMDNLITLCEWHHYGASYGWEHDRDTYAVYMKKWLGKKRWQELERRSKLSIKMSSAIIELMELCKSK